MVPENQSEHVAESVVDPMVVDPMVDDPMVVVDAVVRGILGDEEARSPNFGSHSQPYNWCNSSGAAGDVQHPGAESPNIPSPLPEVQQTNSPQTKSPQAKSPEMNSLENNSPEMNSPENNSPEMNSPETSVDFSDKLQSPNGGVNDLDLGYVSGSRKQRKTKSYSAFDTVFV